MSVALLGLGGNIGDPIANMRSALRALSHRPDVRIAAVSRLYRTPPWGKVDQPFFYNAAARIETSLSAHGLLDLCLDVERGLKRERKERWGPRTIDIDILDMDGIRLHDERLTLPHPRMGERAFVLLPLKDVVPDVSADALALTDRLADLDIGGIEIVSADGEWWREGG